MPTKNDCDPVSISYFWTVLGLLLMKLQDSLVYLCLCSNGQQPNASEYSLTIPYHECQEFGNQCVKRCSATDSACQSACRTSNPCGAQNPTRVNISTTSTSSDTATATSTSNKAASTSDSNPADYTGFGADPTATSSSGSGSSDSNSAQALAVSFGRTYGLVLVLAMVCGGFTFML